MLLFIRSYLQTLRRNKKHSQQAASGIEEEAEEILKEVQLFTMVSHLFWAMWSIVNAQVSQIPFGYWEYASERLDAYLKQKVQFNGHFGDSNLKRKADDMDQ